MDVTRGLFLVTVIRASRWDDSRPMEEQEGWAAHAAFMDALVRDGFVALGGPMRGTPHEALLVVRARNEQEIGARLSDDPWASADLLVVKEIRRWTLRLGSIAGPIEHGAGARS